MAVAQASELPVDLSLLGRQNVQEIQVYVQYKTPALTGQQVAILYTFWLKHGRKVDGGLAERRVPAYKSGDVLPHARRARRSTDHRPAGGLPRESSTMIGAVGRDAAPAVAQC